MATFTGTAASETITPSTVSATVTRNPLSSFPSAAADTIFGNGGTDTLDGGDGNDQIFGGNGNDTIYGGTGNDSLDAGGGTNIIDGGDGDDTIYGGAGADTIIGGLGSDVIYAESGGADQIDGGEGNDEIRTSTDFANVTGGGGYDGLLLEGATGNTIDLATIGIESIGCGEGNDTIDGSGQTVGVIIYSNLGDDVLMGSTFNDTIHPGDGNNTVLGNAGDDTIICGSGNNTIDGGVGNDFISVFDGANSIMGGDGNDHLYGGIGVDTMIGGLGDDYMEGRVGTDTVSYANATAGVMVNLGLTMAQNTVGAGTDTLLSIENLIGSSFQDRLTGTTGNNVLNGGMGTDTVSYANAAAGVTVNLSSGTAQNTVGAGTDQLSNFENLRGSNFNDTLIGDAASNVLVGHLGNDVLDGGAGRDTASYETALTGVTVSLLLMGIAQNTIGAETDTLLNFEHLRGSNFDDTLTGNGGSNILIGGLGNDVLNGGAGLDAASYETAFGGVTVSLLVTGAQNTVNAGTDQLTNIENLKGSVHNDVLVGNAGSNVLIGGLGNDVLNGGGGVDTASYETAAAGVTVNLLLTGAQNTIGAGTDTLSNFENIRGGNFNDTLTGNVGGNTLTGSLGNDTMTGGSGQDNFVFNTALSASTNRDTITDFSPVDDTFVLENAIFTQFAATGALPAGTFVANAGAVAGDANDFLLYDTSTGKLFYDADGNGAGSKVEFVTLVGIPALTAADFTII